MALIECKYCNAKISDRALSCPKCGKSQVPEKSGFFKAYVKLWLKAFNFNGISSKSDFYSAFICSQIINFLLIISFFWADNFWSDNSQTLTGAYLETAIKLALPIHLLGTHFAFLSLSVRGIRGRSSGGYVGLAYIFLLIIILLILIL